MFPYCCYNSGMGNFFKLAHHGSSFSGSGSNERPEPQLDLATLIEAVDAELTSTLVRYADALPMSLITMGKYALAGPGKILSPRRGEPGEDPPRWPLIVLLSCQAASPPEQQDAWRQALPAAVAVEIAMAAADLLDELTDDDPSPFVKEYGHGQALNMGNLMLVMAQQALLWSARGSGAERALAALNALEEMLVRAATGQHLDMLYDGMGADDVSLEMSVQMTELKAGALVSGACRMGALMAGASDEVVDTLTRFGKELGSIAQLTNDIQDVIPQAVEADFERKTDLRQRKRTLPIVFTLGDDAPEPNAVQRAFRGSKVEGEDEEALRRAVVDAGGVQFTSLIMEVHRQHALEALEQLEKLRPGGRAVLAPLLPAEPAQE